MKKNLLTLISFLMMSFSLAAQNFTFDDVCRKLSENPNMTGDFVQEKNLKNSSRPMKSSGKFIFSPDGLLWKTEKPFLSSMVVTKKFIRQTNSKGVSNVQDISQDQIFSNISLMLTSIFNGNSQEILKVFDVKFSSSEKNWTAFLTPKDAQISSVIKSLELSGILSEYAVIQKMVMTELSESSTVYNLLNMKFPKELSQDDKNIFVK
ncbi:MAG: outer membrane lipoprotein carrier protein LolA [Spirochaetia bacterium]|nr:outer membrane lipoprotein carrier protein LolA [Spirochaetia bacterium]